MKRASFGGIIYALCLLRQSSLANKKKRWKKGRVWAFAITAKFNLVIQFV